MFFRLALIILLLPTLYVYLRLLPLFFIRRNKIFFTIALLCLTMAPFATEMLSHSDHGTFSNTLLITGYCSLPFLLYLFLLVLLRDILLGLNRIFKIVTDEAIRSINARVVTGWILILVPLVAVMYGRLHYTALAVNRYHIQIPGQSSTVEHLKIALASDFHIKAWTDISFMSRFVDTVNHESADLLLMPGDLLEGDRTGEQLAEFERTFRDIKTTYGVFASMGNHESHRGRTADDFFRASGITVLRDTAVVIKHAFTLVGRNDGHPNNRRAIEELLRTAPDDLPTIVLDHRPTEIERTSRAGADILVSGHTHGGQLWPLNLITESMYDVDWGYKKVRGTHVFVTSGLQLWGPPVRTVGDSEVMIIDVDFLQ